MPIQIKNRAPPPFLCGSDKISFYGTGLFFLLFRLQIESCISMLLVIYSILENRFILMVPLHSQEGTEVESGNKSRTGCTIQGLRVIK